MARARAAAPIVLKLGGELLEQADDLNRVARRIATLSARTPLVVVHGGRKKIEATLAVVSRRSASNSRLVVLYVRPALRLGFMALFFRRVGEPIRSAFGRVAMRSLLAKYGFVVVNYVGVQDIGRFRSGREGR